MADASRQPPAPSRPTLRVEVVYALPREQVLVTLEMEQGATVRGAIERSGIPARFPEARVAEGNLGIFGRPVALDEPLRDGDRVEIYRPLTAEPGEARRERARKSGKPNRR